VDTAIPRNIDESYEVLIVAGADPTQTVTCYLRQPIVSEQTVAKPVRMKTIERLVGKLAAPAVRNVHIHQSVVPHHIKLFCLAERRFTLTRRVRKHSVMGSGCQFLAVYHAALHDEANPLQRRDVAQRVAGYGDDVSELVDGDRADAILPTDNLGIE